MRAESLLATSATSTAFSARPRAAATFPSPTGHGAARSRSLSPRPVPVHASAGCLLIVEIQVTSGRQRPCPVARDRDALGQRAAGHDGVVEWVSPRAARHQSEADGLAYPHESEPGPNLVLCIARQTERGFTIGIGAVKLSNGFLGIAGRFVRDVGGSFGAAGAIVLEIQLGHGSDLGEEPLESVSTLLSGLRASLFMSLHRGLPWSNRSGCCRREVWYQMAHRLRATGVAAARIDGCLYRRNTRQTCLAFIFLQSLV